MNQEILTFLWWVLLIAYILVLFILIYMHHVNGLDDTSPTREEMEYTLQTSKCGTMADLDKVKLFNDEEYREFLEYLKLL